jgi:membrane protease YdiL (CAAX protease family)
MTKDNSSEPTLPHLPPSTNRWTTLLLVFGMFFPSLIAWIYFVRLAPSPPSQAPGFLPLTIYALGKAIQFGLPLFCIFGLEGRRPTRPALQTKGIQFGLGIGLVIAVGMISFYFGILRGNAIPAQTPARVRDKLELFHAATPLRYLTLAVFLSGIHSFLEEYYWRWFVFGELRTRIGNWLAGILSSLAFMGHHVIVLAVYFPANFVTLAAPFSLCVALGGGIWAWLYARERTLMAPWISHMIVDGAIMLIGYDMVFAGTG